MGKHYYKSLQQFYSIIIIKISDIKVSLVLQISFKFINNLISLNRLVSTLLVFNIYFKIIKLDVPFLSITKCILNM